MHHEELWWVVRDLIELVQGAVPSRVHHLEVDPPEHQALRSRGAISGHPRQSVAIISEHQALRSRGARAVVEERTTDTRELRECEPSESHSFILAITLIHTRNHTHSYSQSHSIILAIALNRTRPSLPPSC